MGHWERVTRLVAAGLVCFSLVLLADEVLDLPHVVLGAHPTPINWTEATLEIALLWLGGTVLLLAVGRAAAAGKRAESDLAERERNLRALLQSLPQQVFVKGRDSKYVTCNRNYADYLGTTPAEIGGSDESQYFPPELAEKHRADDRHIMESSETLTLEEHYPAAGGVRTMLTTKTPFFDEDGSVAGIIGIRTDISDRKEAEGKLRAAVADLARSNMELEQFAYVASHDLQEPLRMVSSFTQLLAQRYAGQLDKDAQEFIAYAVDGANRMQRLIGDLLTYSRVSTRGREFAPVDSHAALGEVLANLEAAIAESGAIVTNDDLPLVTADHSQLVQVFQNLLGNAVKFRSEAPPRVHVSAWRGGAWWTFSVRDNGIGIAPEYAERVFVIFQRLHTREAYPGTGIGLAVCKRIVERHGGRIWVESEPGNGATFFFTLPAAKGENA